MQLRTLALAGAASLLMAGVVHAQPGSSATPGGAPPQSQPGAVNPPSGAQANPPGVYPSTGSAATTPEVTGAPPAPSAGTAGSPAATSAGTNASVTTSVVTNGPIPDTPENRAKYGGPNSRAGQRTAAKGN